MKIFFTMARGSSLTFLLLLRVDVACYSLEVSVKQVFTLI